MYKREKGIKSFFKALGLDDVLEDKTKNIDMQKIIKHYDSFFDEDSWNTREEGLKQLKEYLVEDVDTKSNKKKRSWKWIKDHDRGNKYYYSHIKK